MFKDRKILILSSIFILLIFSFIIYLNSTVVKDKPRINGKLQIVAGENFWGSLVSQIGGDKVNVLSIVSDPNVDPHEYESNTSNARSFSTADYIVLNGEGYDSWGNNLLNATTNNKRRVLTVSNILNKKTGENPHFWYNSNYVDIVVSKMETDLIELDPADSSYFINQYQKLTASLQTYKDKIDSIKRKFSGVKVAATEDIFSYLAENTGLDLVSPQEFIQAVAEGNDPTAQSIVEFQQQLRSGKISVLVYNVQTVTPLTENMKKIANEQLIPLIGVSETIQPPTQSFQDWMSSELTNLEDTLNKSNLGR